MRQEVLRRHKTILLILIVFAVCAVFTLPAQTEYSYAKTKKPGRVIGTYAEAHGKKITVYWNQKRGADGYQVLRAKAGSKSYKKIALLKGKKKNRYVDKNLKPGTYKYKVRAYKKVKRKKVFGKCSVMDRATIVPPCEHQYEHVVIREPEKEVIGIEGDICAFCGKKANVENVYYQPTEEQVLADIYAMKSVYTKDTLTYACNEVTDRLQKAAFGSVVKRHTHTDASKIRVGDVVHVDNGTHYAIAVGFSPGGGIIYCVSGGGGYPVDWQVGYPRTGVKDITTCWQDWDK